MRLVAAFVIASLLGCSESAPHRLERIGTRDIAIPARTLSDTPAQALTLVAAGDVSFGREVGQALLSDPAFDPFASVRSLLASGDVRFCNLESQLSDQKGETQSPHNRLTFTGPPAGADALARAGFSIVSSANNHAWDYGKKALFETIDNLQRVGVACAGTGRTRVEAYRPVIVEHKGFRLGVLAVTDIWNDGVLTKHKAAEHVARADPDGLPAAVRKARKDPRIDVLMVSYHGGVEYLDQPLPRARAMLRAAIDAGADLVVGHHPHVVQGVEWYRDRPILYSLGNLMMNMSAGRPKPPAGYLARIHLEKRSRPKVEACALRLVGATPEPTGAHSGFFAELSALSRPLGGTAVGTPGGDGCAPLTPRPEM